MQPGRISFEPVSSGDFEELLEIRIAAMRESLEKLGRFAPERARARLRQSFYPEHSEFILLDGRRVGFSTLRPEADGYRLDHLYIFPACQSLGIGSHVLRRLLTAADTAQKQVSLGALRGSAANRFYQRHGFVQTDEDEWDIYYVRRCHEADNYQSRAGI